MADTIVIGAGLNGLISAARLARAGHKVLLLEKRERVGGTAVTEEFAPGFKADTCLHDIGHVPVGLVRELELERHGLKQLSSPATIFAPSLDGDSIWLDPAGPRSASDVRLPTSDLQRWPEFARLIHALAGYLGVLHQQPVPPIDSTSLGDLATLSKLALRLRFGLGKHDMVEFLRVLPMSVAELVDDWFEHSVLKGVLASRGVMHLAQGPRAQGTAFNLLHHQVGRGPGAFRSHIRPLGGVGALADALAASARAAGAEIRTGAPVSHIYMKGGRATGVVLAGGEEIPAARIVSAVSPRATFLELCDPSRLPPEFVRAVRNIRYRGVWAKVNVALDGLPAFRGVTGEEMQKVRSIVIAPSVDYVERAHDCAKYGRVSERPWLEVFIPTAIEKSWASEAKHVISIHVQYAPYRLGDGAWDTVARERLGDLVMKTLAEYAPELPDRVLHRQVLTPVDLEREFGLPEGQAHHAEIALDQAFFMRPVPELSRGETPVEGLWLSGAGLHPGSGAAARVGVTAASALR